MASKAGNKPSTGVPKVGTATRSESKATMVKVLDKIGLDEAEIINLTDVLKYLRTGPFR